MNDPTPVSPLDEVLRKLGASAASAVTIGPMRAVVYADPVASSDHALSRRDRYVAEVAGGASREVSIVEYSILKDAGATVR